MMPEKISSSKMAILGLAAPELFNIIVQMVYILDMRLIAQTQLPVVYLGVGILYTFIHVFIKMAESLGVATLVLSSRALAYEEQQRRVHTQQVLKSCLLLSVGVSALVVMTIWNCADYIINWYCLPGVWQTQALSYLRLRGLGLGLLLAGMPLTGLLRAQGRTAAVMASSLIAVAAYILIDYMSLWGLHETGLDALTGSACAAIMQQAIMIIGCCIALTWSGDLSGFLRNGAQGFCTIVPQFAYLSVPIMVDKTALALAKVWLARMICTLGPQAQAAFCVVKDLEQIAFIPALAIASACTILVSRQWALGEIRLVGHTIVRSCILGCSVVGLLVIILSLWARFFIAFFDIQRICSDYAAYALASVSVLVIADVIQLILAAALRAIRQTATVMIVRLTAIIVFMMPLSYAGAHYLPASKEAFLVVFGSFYIAGIAMSTAYSWWLSKMIKRGIYGAYKQ
jgi:Na+-driven multidrug efflux pump